MGELFDDVERQALAHVARVGEQLRDGVKESVGHQFPPSSRPGEYPHKRTGNLQEKITVETRIENGRVVTTLRSGAPYSARLVVTGRLLFQGLASKWRQAIAAVRITRG